MESWPVLLQSQPEPTAEADRGRRSGSPGSTSFQAAPAAYPYRSATERVMNIHDHDIAAGDPPKRELSLKKDHVALSNNLSPSTEAPYLLARPSSLDVASRDRSGRWRDRLRCLLTALTWILGYRGYRGSFVGNAFSERQVAGSYRSGDGLDVAGVVRPVGDVAWRLLSFLTVNFSCV